MTEQPNEKLIFAIDPGSVRVGWCIMRPPGELIEGGVIVPEKLKAPNHARINDLCKDLRELLDEWMPGVILIEWASGHVGRKRHRGAGAYLSIYGIAVGALWREVVNWKESLPEEQRLEVEIVLIDEIRWTNQVCKLDRALAVAGMFPKYKIKKDPGMDLADAVGICVYYIRDCSIRSGRFDVG